MLLCSLQVHYALCSSSVCVCVLTKGDGLLWYGSVRLERLDKGRHSGNSIEISESMVTTCTVCETTNNGLSELLFL